VAELAEDAGAGSNPYGVPMKDKAWRAEALPAASAASLLREAEDDGPGWGGSPDSSLSAASDSASSWMACWM